VFNIAASVATEAMLVKPNKGFTGLFQDQYNRRNKKGQLTPPFSNIVLSG